MGGLTRSPVFTEGFQTEVIKLFSCSTQLSMKFQLLINFKIAYINGIFRLKGIGLQRISLISEESGWRD